jgi:hypothetical protein
MAAELLSFFRPAVGAHGDWSAQEIAEFYRVEAALVQAGVSVIVDRGISDEGDPWFVFCRAADHEVIVHFARIAGQYIIATEAMGQTSTGKDFRRLLTEFVSRNPSLLPLSSGGGAKLFLHPAALLAAVVATALYYMSGTEAIAHSIDATTAVHHFADDQIGQSHSGLDADLDRKSQHQQLAAAVVAMIALATADFFQPSPDPHVWLVPKVTDASLDPSERTHLVTADNLYRIDTFNSHTTHPLNSDGHLTWNEEQAAGSGSVAAIFAPNSVPEKTVNASGSLPDKIIATSQDPQGHLHSNALADGGLQDQNGGQADAGGNVLGFGKTDIPLASLDHQLALKPDVSHIDREGFGSSTPDTIVSNSFDAQTTLASLDAQSGMLHRALAQVNLVGSLSIEEVIIHTANDLFGGSSLPIMTGLFDEKASAPSILAASLPDINPSEHPQPVSDALEMSRAANQNSSSHYPLFDSEAGAIISSFVKLNSFEIITSNRNIVLFDISSPDFASPDFGAKTWSMHDGSTISIVGILPHTISV